MLMTGDGVFLHRRGTKATYLLLGLFCFLRWHFGGPETPSHHSPNGPKPKYRQYSASAAPVFAYFYHQQQKYTLSGWSHQWTARLLREALSELCKRAPDGHDNSKSHGTLPYPNVQTTVYQNRGQIR